MPLSVMYFFAQKLHHMMRRRQYRRVEGIFTICIGNITAGGGGKTPLAISLAQQMEGLGKLPLCFISRGYGGSLSTQEALQVDPKQHSAQQVGDEPLLLASHHPCFICQNRANALDMAASLGYKYAIIDDGLQNPTFHKNFSILVIDGKTGMGNHMLLPAGPMRQRLKDAVMSADICVIIGDDEHNCAELMGKLPVIHAHVRPLLSRTQIEAQMSHKSPGYERIIAFAGIAHPEKFFTTLREEGFDNVHHVPLPDHHMLDEQEEEKLIELAKQENAALLTTQKDYVRLSPPMRDITTPYPITIDTRLLIEQLHLHMPL